MRVGSQRRASGSTTRSRQPLTEQEAVSISARGRENDDQGHGSLKRKTGEGCVEGLVAGEELAEGKDTLAPELLVDATLAEEDGEAVSGGWKVVKVSPRRAHRQSSRAGTHTLPMADRAMMTEIARPAASPNIFSKKTAAMSLLEVRISALGTAAKKAMLTSM